MFWEEKALANSSAAASTAFLEKNKTKPGVKTTPGGLQYEVVKQGTGPKPAATDTVNVHYHGTLPDGTKFDEAQDAPLLVGQVVPGFAEALQNMRPNGRYKVRIPGALAYGATPPPGSPIPANSPLDFEITVKRVVKDAAAQMGAQPLPPGAGVPPPEPAPERGQ